MKKKGTNNPITFGDGDESEEFNLFIKGFVIGMPTNCIILEYFVTLKINFTK